jgi:murein DD-endopeptidase MepM/ murein hydrolase activator NlpD
MLMALIFSGLLVSTSGCSLAKNNTSISQVPTPTPSPQPEQTATATAASQIVALSTVTPTPTTIPTPTPTPVIPPLPIPTPPKQPYIYHTITSGETLSYLSAYYDISMDELIDMNQLSGPDAIIQIDQQLRVPAGTADVAPVAALLPDSEVVFGPSSVDFDIAAFIKKQDGYLADYQEYVNGQSLTGAEIVELVAEQFSVGPRLLLALLEHYGGWVTHKTLTEAQLNAPYGKYNPRGGNLYLAMSFTANRINAGYYGYKRDGFWIFRLPDGHRAISPEGANAGTIGVQNILAVYSDWETWNKEIAGDGMLAVYRQLFGNPFAHQLMPLVPIDLKQPPLSLPWEPGTAFYLTSGPHAGYVDGSGWAAIDFGPPDVLGNCFYSAAPSTAAADGVIVSARPGEIYLDLDGDGQIQTGWVLLYMHTALDADTPVKAGQQVKKGDIIGYASCEAGLSDSSHLHFARRYNGEWIAAGGPVPMNLDGWVVQPNLVPYEGKMVRDDEVREACECWDPDLNYILNPAP